MKALPSTSWSLLVALALSASLVGCDGRPHSKVAGYSWSSLYRQDIRTIAVPIFRNVDYSRGDEFALTRAIVQQIETKTPYKVVSRERADSLLEGEIVSVTLGGISRDSLSALPMEQLYTVTVNFTWKDLRTGQVLVERKGFQHAVSMFPTLGESRETGQQLNAEALATAIVQELQGDW